MWVTNRILGLVASQYFEKIYETRAMPNYIGIDKGSKNCTTATMHYLLRRQHFDVETDEEALKTV